MTRGRIFTVFLLILGTGVLPAPAHADPVRITSGALVGGRSEVRLNATGERGLALNAAGSEIDGTFVGPVHSCTDCPPGHDLSLDVFSIFNGGSISIDGLTFNIATGDGFDSGHLDLRFSSSVILPEFSGDPVIALSAPFRVEGHTSFEAPASPVELFGSGIATVMLEWEPDRPIFTGWYYRGLRFDFEPAAPVPEPASLLLLGSAVAALAGVRSRRRLR
jgi:hypothetical protein